MMTHRHSKQVSNNLVRFPTHSYTSLADFELNRNNSKCFCCNNSLQSAQVEYDGTRKHSSNDLGLEEAHQQRWDARSTGDTKF